MVCIVGLGNPGKEYAETRHNVGFRVIERLAVRHEISVSRHRMRAVYGRGRIDGVDVVLAMPQTFMNDSGDATGRLTYFYKIEPSNVVIVYDDMNLELGQVRIRRGGSDGGHKGVRSIISRLGTNDIPRLRLGVGSPPAGQNAINYVLAPFARSEHERVEAMLDTAAEALEVWLREGVEAAMNRYNS